MTGISIVTAARLAKYKKRRLLPNGGQITWPVALEASAEPQSSELASEPHDEETEPFYKKHKKRKTY